MAGGPVAPKDPTKKRKGFYIMRGKNIAASPTPDGKGTQFLYMSDGRMISSAKLVGGIQDENMLNMMRDVEGFRKLVHSIGIVAEADDKDMELEFCFQMYGKTDPYNSGTTIRVPMKANGMEYMVHLDEIEWSEDDNVPGQIRFEFQKPELFAQIAVKFYLQDGFDAPDVEDEAPVNFDCPEYKEMLNKSLLNRGNLYRLQKAIKKAKAGEDVTIGFIGGSITQGAGAIPINKQCYAYKTFEGFCKMVGKGTDENIHYVKAGVGGTPSELGMIRYDKDVLRDGKVTPDIVVIEFAVNDEGDETKGDCYDALARKAFQGPGEPAVILIFAVFADDFNLQERLSPVGFAYDLPMVSTKDTVIEQFYKKAGEGKVVSKNQFFYDCFHPTNTGHTVMADGLLHLMQIANEAAEDEKPKDLSEIETPKSADFENVKLFDLEHPYEKATVSCGDFCEKDSVLQAVEMDLNLHGTPEFTGNWMHKGVKTGASYEMDIVCRHLLIVYKDSSDIAVGVADVFVDGEKVLTIDPHKIGWTHCNPYICIREKEAKQHHVEVKMAEGSEDKEFTILGWGYVEA